jgi:hypothetical protein
VVERDALVLSFLNGPYNWRYTLFDIGRRQESPLFELTPAGRPIVSAVWREYLFVSLGRDLLVYDLRKRVTVKYENDLMRETAGDRGGVKRLLLDGDRLIAASLDDESARVIDLKAYLKGLPAKDVFAPRPR